MPPSLWQGKNSSVNWTAHKRIIYHCLQMADQRSIEMLAFNFASRTFAYRRLVQSLSQALSATSSFARMRAYLDKIIEADQYSPYVDDVGIAANDAD